MRMLPLALLASLTAALAGCASPHKELKEPVFARCNGSGLRGCDELTHGVLLYVDGEEDSGRYRLWRAGSQNSPERLRAFASSLDELGKSPSADAYAEPMLEASRFLAMQASRVTPAAAAQPAATPPAPQSPGAPRVNGPAVASPTVFTPANHAAVTAPGEPPGALTADTDPARLEAGVAAPGSSPAKVPCGAIFGAGSAYCITAIEGPFVVTDLHMPAGCPNELFVAAGSSTAPRWALLGAPSSPIAIHGARMLVKQDELLFVGAQAASPARISTEARCSVTWGGFRPYTGASEPRQVPRDLGF